MSRRIAALVVFGAALAFHASYAFHGIALFDEGLLADGATRVLDHESLGRDAFVPYGPGSYWVLAPCFAWFGKSLVTLRWVTIVIQAIADTAILLLALARSTPMGALLAATLLAVAHGSLHKSFLLLAAVLSLWTAHLVAKKSDGWSAACAGALAGVAFLFRHDAGTFAAVSLAVALVMESRSARAPLLQRLAALGGGMACVVVPAFLMLLAAGLDPRMWWDHEWQRIAAQERIRVAFPWPLVDGSWRWGRATLCAALIAAPTAQAAWGAAAIVRRARGRSIDGDTARVGSALFGLLLLNQARLVPSNNHLFQAFAPFALALADLLARRGRGRLAHAGFALLVAAVIAWVATARDGPYSGSFQPRIDGATRLELPTAGVWLDPSEAQSLRALVLAVQRRVPEVGTIVTSPSCPLVGFLAERRLALPYAEPSYYFDDRRFQEEAIAALEQRKPSLYVHDPRPAATRALDEAAPLLADYLARHYRRVEEIAPFTLYERLR